MNSSTETVIWVPGIVNINMHLPVRSSATPHLLCRWVSLPQSGCRIGLSWGSPLVFPALSLCPDNTDLVVSILRHLRMLYNEIVTLDSGFYFSAGPLPVVLWGGVLQVFGCGTLKRSVGLQPHSILPPGFKAGSSASHSLCHVAPPLIHLTARL